jgi:hypothetical protein
MQLTRRSAGRRADRRSERLDAPRATRWRGEPACDFTRGGHKQLPCFGGHLLDHHVDIEIADSIDWLRKSGTDY